MSNRVIERIGRPIRVSLLSLTFLVPFLVLAQAVGVTDTNPLESATLPESLRSSQGYVAPSPRSEHDLAFDAESDRIILFGGWDGTSSLGDTWAYDFNANEWQEMNPTTSPRARRLHAMAYDRESDRVILYSGVRTDALIPTGDTWAYDFNTNNWTNMAPATMPPPRWGRVAYDEESDRVVLFGGAFGHLDSVFNDTWAYDFNNNSWTQMSSRPTRATSHAMAYDSQSDRIVVFGGEGAPFEGAEGTWSYDLTNDTWINMSPSSEPPLGIHYASDYDSIRDRVVLWGGRSLGGFVEEILSYDFNSNVWETAGITAGPSKRNLHRMAFDAESERLVMFGGRTSGVGFNNETWSLVGNLWTPQSPLKLPEPPRDLEAAAETGQIGLVWAAPRSDGGYPIIAYRLYRGTTSNNLSLHEEVGNVLTYKDLTVADGTNYFYQATAVTLAGESQLSNEVGPIAALAPHDDEPPEVTITFPHDGTMVDTASLTASGTVTDNTAVEMVEVSLDGTTWALATLEGSSWSATLTLQDGPNTIRARATDSSGNTAVNSVEVGCVCPEIGPTPPGPDLLVIAIATAAGGVAIAGSLYLVRRRNG